MRPWRRARLRLTKNAYKSSPRPRLPGRFQFSLLSEKQFFHQDTPWCFVTVHLTDLAPQSCSIPIRFRLPTFKFSHSNRPMPSRISVQMDPFPELKLPESRVLIIITGRKSSSNYMNRH